MAPGTQAQKEGIAQRLAWSRASIRMPDTAMLLEQSRQLGRVATQLPAAIQARPARTAIIVGSVACCVALLIAPKRKRRREQAKFALGVANSRTIPRQLLSWTLLLAQPLVRVWATEQTKRWLRRRA